MKKKKTREATNSHRIYWPGCSVCQYLKKHQDLKLALMNSSYFNADGVESVPQVLARYNVSIPLTNMYTHFKRHQAKDLENRRLQVALKQVEDAREHKQLIKRTEGPVAIQGVPIDVLGDDYKPEHVLGLEEFIKAGREKMRRGEMPFTASNYLQAIKIHSEIDKAKQDSKVDVFKTMFAGASGEAGGFSEQQEGS